MTYLHKNHQQLDLCFAGNLGFNGVKNTIEKIEKLENTEILINENDYWQEAEKIRYYVAENGEKIGKVNELNIYKLKKVE